MNSPPPREAYRPVLIVQRPTISEDVLEEGVRSAFSIEPLEPGFGYTLGNSLRRTLLSSIPGAAVTSVRIEGVLHEFSSIEGVKEDVTDVILNLKDLVLRSHSDEPVEIFLGGEGPGEISADFITAPSEVEILNRDLHIATLNRKGRVEMYLTVERGRGYVTADRNKHPDQAIGVIPIDSIYSPVKRVTYRVEAPRVEQMTNYDRLILDVETNGSVTPAEALSSAGETLRDLFGLFADFEESGPGGLSLRADVDLARSDAAHRRHGPVRALLQLPEARGRLDRRRAGAEDRAGPAGHPQLRLQVDRRGQGQARRDGVGAVGVRLRGLSLAASVRVVRSSAPG